MLFFLNNGLTCIYFDKGNFDEYCVYINDVCKQKRYAPKDKDYFEWIRILSVQYGCHQVWSDFCAIYDIVDNNETQEQVLNLIYDIDMHYNSDTIIWWLIFYMTMLAECKKAHTILKKRIKKLGVYNIFFDKYDIDYIIKYMRGMKWQELDALMVERGI